MRVRLLIVVAALVLLGVALVAAQGEGPRSPNDVTALDGAVDEPVHSLAPEEMVGRSPNEGQLEQLEPAAAENNLPLEAMVGRSPNGDVGTEADAAAPEVQEEVAVAGGIRFLVTNTNTNGAVADSSCPTGFHMANVYELTDVTHLTYAKIPGAKTRTDQGSGPVAGWYGWVRTGNDSYTGNTAGRANCALWTSAGADQYGTIVRLAESWTAGGVAVSPWQALTWSCSGSAPTWCIED